MRLLLHTCCAPCSIYAIQEAEKDGFDITGFFYNPNIHPAGEYERRKKEAEDYFKSKGLELVTPEYNMLDFFKYADFSNTPKDRCRTCWELRIKSAFLYAKKAGFDAFTTTLLGSPYQDHGLLKSICEAVGQGPEFYYKDFRKGFSAAHKLAREKGMYRQNYCGCVFSLAEREEAKKKRLADSG